MKSFQEIYTELQDDTGDTDAAGLVIFKRHIVDTENLVLAKRPWKFLEKTDTIATTDDGERYELPADLRKIMEVITDQGGTINYRPSPVEDPAFWELLKAPNNARVSDIPLYYYLEDNDILVWPAYDTASHTITVRYRKRIWGLSLDDYTTGTITSITNDARALIGDSTSWTGRDPVQNQWIRIDYTTGDRRWYKIASIDSATTITLEIDYLGVTIAAATEIYTIGEMSIIPGDYHNLLVYRPLALYHQAQQDLQMADRYWRLYDGGHEAGLISANSPIGGLLGDMINEQAGMRDATYMEPHNVRERINPNDPPRDLTFP